MSPSPHLPFSMLNVLYFCFCRSLDLSFSLHSLFSLYFWAPLPLSVLHNFSFCLTCKLMIFAIFVIFVKFVQPPSVACVKHLLFLCLSFVWFIFAGFVSFVLFVAFVGLPFLLRFKHLLHLSIGCLFFFSLDMLFSLYLCPPSLVSFNCFFFLFFFVSHACWFVIFARFVIFVKFVPSVVRFKH